jgi:DNA-binding transcriptional LysR family regulator
MVIDLNLLRIFDVLLEERSVTRAGLRLGLSQSAVSHALNRLRYSLGDDLFVRGSAGMEPTPRAQQMGPQVRAAINQLQAALSPPDFDPAVSEGRFNLVAGAYACAVLAPALVNRLASLAPGMELAVADHSVDVVEMMDARQTDFMIGSVLAAPERLARETLMMEELAWVVSVNAPLAQRNDVDLEALASTPHIVIARRSLGGGDARRGLVGRGSWEDAGALESALAAQGLKRRVGVTVPDTYAALAIAARSEMAALVPRRLALMSSGKLKHIEPPYASPPAPISLIYLAERLSEPPIAWMRRQIREVAAAL